MKDNYFYVVFGTDYYYDGDKFTTKTAKATEKFNSIQEAMNYAKNLSEEKQIELIAQSNNISELDLDSDELCYYIGSDWGDLQDILNDLRNVANKLEELRFELFSNPYWQQEVDTEGRDIIDDRLFKCQSDIRYEIIKIAREMTEREEI